MRVQPATRQQPTASKMMLPGSNRRIHSVHRHSGMSAASSYQLSQRGAITKRMMAIEEMAGMDVLCSVKTAALTLNRLTVDRNLIEVFNRDMDKDILVLLAARASRLENQDAIDAAIINMLADPKEANLENF